MWTITHGEGGAAAFPVLFTGGQHVTKQVQSHRCIRVLVYGTGLGIFYPLLLIFSVVGLETVPPGVIGLFWAVVKLLLAYGTFCIYTVSRENKHALVTLLLTVSALFVVFTPHPFLANAVEALAITGFSLVLFDIGRARPETQLEWAGGLIFIGVVFSILNTPATGFIAAVALLFGMVLAATRLMRL